MKKNLRRVLLVLLFLFVVFASINLARVNAATVKTDDGQYNYTTVSEKETELADGATFFYNLGYTTRSNTKYDQRVSVFVCDTAKNSDVKVATWNILNETNDGFTRRGLLEIAKDYEKHNPGWKVLAGINADQYFPTFGTGLGTNGSSLFVPSAYYGQISNGENWFVSSPYNNPNNIVGFKNDGSAKPFVNGARTDRGIYLFVYDKDGNEIGRFPTDGLNSKMGSKGIVVLASHINSDKSYTVVNRTSENNIYYVENADFEYVSDTVDWKSWNTNATNQMFGKGTISKVTKTVSFSGSPKFAIEVNNSEVEALLSVGTYIKVQNQFDEAFDNVYEGIGYHTVQRSNGKDNNVANSYNSRAYPRSFFGFDKEGKAYLMTCFGDNASPLQGLFAQEINAFCKNYGVTDCWQMDGGGSVTSIVRNQQGELQYNEACIEATHNNKFIDTYDGYRYILSGLFIVIKTPEADVEVTDIDAYSAKVKIDVSKMKDKYASATLRIMVDKSRVYQEYPLDLTKDSNEFNAKGLIPYTDYTYLIYGKKKGAEGEEVDTFFRGGFNTYREKPLILAVSGNGEGVTIKFDDNNKSIVSMVVKYGENTYECVIDPEKPGIAKASLPSDVKIFDLKVIATCKYDKQVALVKEYDLDTRCISVPTVQMFDQIMKQADLMLDKLIK